MAKFTFPAGAWVPGLILGTLTLAGGIGWSLCRAEDKVTSKPVAADRKADLDAIVAVSARFVAGFEKGDADAVAGLLTTDAELIPEGADALQGRAAIKAALAKHFAKHPNIKMTLDVESRRFPSRDTALEEGQVTTTLSKGEVTVNRYSMLYVREDEKWLLASVKERAGEEVALQELDWLIGTWTAKRGDSEALTTYEWFGNKSFIRATFAIKAKGEAVSGMQMIGTDPDGGLFTRMFEVDGGYGEGTCRREGKKWVFESKSTLGDGRELACTNIMVQIDQDTFTWQPTNVTLGGEELPNQPPVKVRRLKK